ncbi:D-malate dehydrogenase [decarboxylating] [Methylibium sp. T29-B]|nr:D-malate dehydrogenase [decarboxylating] [Methylibium sp. T29-B]
MKPHRIAVIPGDGIGQEVMPEGLRVLEVAAQRFELPLQFDHFDWACAAYWQRTGRCCPTTGSRR